MKTGIYKLVFLFLGLSALTGCGDFLDTTPTDSVSDKLVWSKPEYAELAVNDFYNIIDALGQFDTAQSAVGLTEGMTDVLKYGSTALNTHMWFANELAYALNGIPANTASYFLGNWSYCYTRLARINQALSNLYSFKSNFDTESFNRLEAELRFFRGFIYFELMKRYKEVIIYDKDMQAIKAHKALSTETEGWNFVKEDLSFAATTLPATSSTGRLTCGAAYALLSRAMLYAERWDDAAAAAYAVIESHTYSLMPSYADAFSKTKAQGNTESILEYEYNKEGVTHNFDDNFTPGGDPGRVLGALGTPTQEMVECYEYATTGGYPDWSTWHSTSGTTATPPFANLEPRFAATILYNGASWKGRTIEPYEGGADGYIAWRSKSTNEGKTTTGYFLRKLVDETHDLSTYSRSTQPWIAIRYAEVLLNYAEACCKGTSADGEKNARNALTEVRARVGLPKINKNGDELLQAIYRERKVELAYEGQLYWDMRRLKLAETAYSNYRVHGLKVTKAADGTFTYTYIDCDGQNRYFPAKLYHIPLPQDELEGNSLVKQYIEWR